MATLKFWNSATNAWEYVPTGGNASYSGIVPSGSTTATINHGLGTTAVAPQCFRIATGELVMPTFTVLDPNRVQLTFATAPTAGEYRVLVISAIPNESPVGSPRSSGRWERITDQTITSSTYTAIIFDREDHNDDPDSLWTMNMATGMLTINVGGVYFLSGQVPWRSTGTGHDAVHGIVTSTSRNLARQNVWDEGGNFAQGGMLTTGPVYLAAGTVIYLEAYQNTGGNMNTYGDTNQGPHLAIESIGGNTVLDNRYAQKQSILTPVTFDPSWGEYGGGGGFDPVGCHKIGDQVFLQGVCQRTAVSTDNPDLVLTLPIGFRPELTGIFFQPGSAAAGMGLRVDVQNNGQVIVYNHDTGATEWLSLSGITFRAGN